MNSQYGPWAVITGGCSGIGLAFAKKFASEGIHLFLISENEKRLAESKLLILANYKVQVQTCCIDLSEPDFMGRLTPRLDALEVGTLINAASFGQLEPFFDTPLEKHMATIRVSIDSYVLLTHLLLAKMKLRDRGALITVASVNAFSPVAYSSVYTSAKAFELYFGQALWEELRREKSGVDALVVCPAATKTNFQSAAGTRVAPWAWEPEKVVDLALKSLGNKPHVISTWRGKAYYYITKFLPRAYSIRFATWAINSNLRRPDREKIRANVNWMTQ